MSETFKSDIFYVVLLVQVLQSVEMSQGKECKLKAIQPTGFSGVKSSPDLIYLPPKLV